MRTMPRTIPFTRKLVVSIKSFLLGGNAFDPSDLFTGGYQGAWYDPSDLSTMFQDSGGTTPVTADSQPVGLILDKSQGLALGSELVSNGTFDSNITGWTKGSGTTDPISWSSGKLRVTNDLAYYASGTTNVTCVIGRTYLVKATVTAKTISAARIYLAFGALNESVFGIVGQEVQFYFLATATTHTITCASDDNTLGVWHEWDNISVKEIAGNHARQATAGARPLYKTSGGLHWLEFDGIDDCLTTGSIDFTASDKMNIFIGSEALSPSPKVFLELSASTGVFPGSFYITDSESVNNLGTYRMQGSIGSGGYLTSAPPSLSVMTFAFDIGGDSVSVRSNGSAAAGNMSAGSDAGTGNFGNWPLYIAARGGSALYFTGKIYQLCIVGKTASGTEITNTETFINGKTGAY